LIKKNSFHLLGVLALLLAFGAFLVACSKEDSSGGGGSTVSAANASNRATLAADFAYDVSEDGEGVVITRYAGNGSKLVIPEKIEGLLVVELGESAFYGESDNGGKGPGYNLISVVIPASVKIIKSDCFRNCVNLTSVTIQGTGVEIGKQAFLGCTELTELVIPDGDNVIFPLSYGDAFNTGSAYVLGNDAFGGCKKLPLSTRSRLNAMGFEYI
jgi:hypothetical protein